MLEQENIIDELLDRLDGLNNATSELLKAIECLMEIDNIS
jgi:hypothetical protein